MRCLEQQISEPQRCDTVFLEWIRRASYTHISTAFHQHGHLIFDPTLQVLGLDSNEWLDGLDVGLEMSQMQPVDLGFSDGEQQFLEG